MKFMYIYSLALLSTAWAVNTYGQLSPDQQQGVTPPFLEVTEPSNNSVTARRWIDVRGTITDNGHSPYVLIDGVWADGIVDDHFVYARHTLTAGVNRIVVTGHDRPGNVSTQIVVVTQDLSLDTLAPKATLNLPDGVFCGRTNMSVNGTVDDETAQIILWVSTSENTNGPFNMLNTGASFWGNIALNSGTNTIAVVSSDASGNTSTSTYSAVSDTSKYMLVTYPAAHQVMNAPATEVWGVASPIFSNANILVNGQSTYVFPRRNQIGFVTWMPVYLNAGRTMVSATCELDGTTYYSQ